ncbi:single-stranded-DNA-specific exonuclease RecJ [Occallatibacter riparius]|uniref:Single-stranded-DNA-specific exonuclease RecJ n=1 Tax=Occallatibacter riparius TaxID=1002689 RepID=A0A9J7BJJ2_9BACT|nr:single-stranded-DNA-specific exonuclease RecJ [Occallatibacter riparius]UWZ82992.1 single-stranded-DNA-specific exonuclease RecJ [Occallatibacter riparius]
MGTTAGAAAPGRATRTFPRQRWVIAPPHTEQAEALAKAANLPAVLSELLVARGVTDAHQAHRFLNPDVGHLHDPLLMLGMAEAVGRVERAIAADETILLYGDYDVDGTTAVVLLKTAIEMLGGSVRFHVPHRIREGYGLQSSVLEQAYAEGVRLVITVDTGMRAFAEADTARRLGLDLIVTDHHLPSATEAPPDALAILNPNQVGCGYPEKSLCGAAVALKLAQALLERRDPARTREKTLPSFLKMAAIATIADAVPLHGENRTIAALGLRELRHPVGAGLRALFSAAQLDPAAKALTGFDVAFRLAPRINAAGRMDVASQVIELFCTRDGARAQELATNLESLNRQRREAEAAALTTIDSRLADDAEFAASRLLVVDGEGWHRGVIGILASRVVERTAKPAIVVSVEDNIAHGSGRSVDGFPLLEAIETCGDLFTRFGGHAFAVGFAMPAEALPELRRRLNIHAEERLGAKEPEHLLRIHAELPLDRITSVLAGWLKKLEPLGHGNPEPIFMARGARIASAPRIMKDRHIRLDLQQDSMGAGGRTTRCVGWDWAERCLQMQLVAGSQVDVAYRIRENDHPQYGGVEIEAVGIRPAEA